MKKVALLAFTALACGKNPTPPTADAAAATPIATPIAVASASAAPSKASAWTVKYTIAAGTLYIPDNKDWSSAKFKNDDSKYLGDGTMTLDVDGAGRVSGASTDGPLGATVASGLVENGTLAATIRRKDPSDDGLTGTLLAKIEGDKLEGSMRLAEANAAVVREAKLTAAKSSK